MSSGNHAEAALRSASAGRSLLRPALVLVALSFLVHAAVSFCIHSRYPERAIATDTPSYVYPAETLLRQGRFLECCGSSPMFFRTPGYPAFLAAVRALFGDSGYPVLLLQGVIFAATAWFVYRSAGLFCSQRTALAAAVLCAADPVSFTVSHLFLADALFAFLVALFTWLALKAFPGGRLALPIAAGALLGVSALVKPVASYLVLPVVLVAVLGPRVGWARRARAAACLFLSCWLVLGLWQFRNRAVLGTWQFSGIQAVNLLMYRAAGVLAEEEGIPLQAAQQRLLNELHIDPAGLRSPAVNARLHEKSVEVIRAAPLAYLKISLRGAAILLGTSGRNQLLDYYGTVPGLILRLYSLLYLAALYFGFACALRGFRRFARPHWLLLLTVAYFVVVTGPEGYWRYRIPFIPALSILAALGFARIGRLRRADAPPPD